MPDKPISTSAGRYSRAIRAGLIILILIPAVYFRSAGLFRGLADQFQFHPDESKQVMTLFNYLQGRHVHYFDSLFYDGYPYGLNRVDEAIIRGSRLLIQPIRTMLAPSAEPLEFATRADLFPVARVLRVFYGIISILLVYMAVKRLCKGAFAPAYAALIILALAPLGSSVTHSATGDSGVDLFLALSLYAMAGYAAGGSTKWIALASIAVGCAFGCKYQGALGVWLVALPPVLMLLGRKTTFAKFVLQSSIGFTGFISGALLTTPAFFINAKRTWNDIIANIAFIRDYGADPAFLELPFVEKAAWGIRYNIPLIIRALGPLLTLAALGGMLCAVSTFIKFLRQKQTNPDDSLRRQAVWVAICTFPFAAGLFSILLKPAVQPFHFSYLLHFLATAAALLFYVYWNKQQLTYKAAAVLMAVFTIGSALPVVMRENFYWQREDSALSARQYAGLTHNEPLLSSTRQLNDNPVRLFYVEPSFLPVFRNRPTAVYHPAAALLQNISRPRLPQIPAPYDNQWLMMHGPAFLRNDRILNVTPGRRQQRTLAFHNTLPQYQTVGVRSGRWPAYYEIKLGNQTVQACLPPHSQTNHVLKLKYNRRQNAWRNFPEVYHVNLTAHSSPGKLWLLLPADNTEFEAWEKFGPDYRSDDMPVLQKDSNTAGLMAMMRYIEATAPVTVSAQSPLLHDTHLTIPAGVYRLNAEILYRGSDNPSVTLEISDNNGIVCDYFSDDKHFPISHGLNRIEWLFEKPFTPYEIQLALVPSHGEMQILEWELRPATQHSMASRLAVQKEPPQTEWLEIGALFPKKAVLTAAAFPATAQAGQQLYYNLRFKLIDTCPIFFSESQVFVHVKDQAGNQVAGLDFPLRHAAFCKTDNRLLSYIIPADIRPGSYIIETGMYNFRTGQRYNCRTPSKAHPVRRQSLSIQKILIE